MFIGWHGEPCSRCSDRTRLHLVKRTATHHGMCAQCWLGATETERLLALFEEQCVQIEEAAAARLARDDAFEAYCIDRDEQALRADLDSWGMAA